MDRRQSGLVDVGGEDLAAVGELSRDGERLAAAPGTEVQHLGRRTGGCSSDQGRHLRSLILHLEPAPLELGLGLDVGRAARTLWRGDADALGRERRGGGTVGGEGLHHLFARRLQRVDAEICRSPPGESPAFGDGPLAEGLNEGQPEPLRHIGCHMRRRGGRQIAREACRLVRRQCARRMLAAIAKRARLRDRQSPGGHGCCKRDGPRRIRAHARGERQPQPQRVINQIADGRAVTGAGKPVRLAPIGQSGRCRTVAIENVLEDFDGSREACGGAHGLGCCPSDFQPALSARYVVRSGGLVLPAPACPGRLHCCNDDRLSARSRAAIFGEAASIRIIGDDAKSTGNSLSRKSSDARTTIDFPSASARPSS